MIRVARRVADATTILYKVMLHAEAGLCLLTQISCTDAALFISSVLCLYCAPNISAQANVAMQSNSPSSYVWPFVYLRL